MIIKPLNAKLLNATITIEMAMLLFSVLLRKALKLNMVILLYIFRKRHECKMKSMSTSYFCKYYCHEKSNGNTCKTNIKGPKMIWVPNVRSEFLCRSALYY